MKAWFGQLFGDENSKADEMAILAVLSVLVFLGLSIFAVVFRDQPWDPRTYGESIGGVLFAAATGMGLKAKLGG